MKAYVKVILFLSLMAVSCRPVYYVEYLNEPKVEDREVDCVSQGEVPECIKQPYMYVYNWKCCENSKWSTKTFTVDKELTLSEAEVYRQTMDYKMIQSGKAHRGVVYNSYVEYCCRQRSSEMR